MSKRIRKMDSRRIMFRRSRRIRKTDSRRNGSESRRGGEKSQVKFINIKNPTTTLQTGTGKVDPALKFKCTTAARGSDKVFIGTV